MKYKINGLNPTMTIRNFKSIDNYIKVYYLDGTCDIIEKNAENINNLLSLMNDQANQYVADYSMKEKSLSHQAGRCIKLSIILSLFAIFMLVGLLTGMITVPTVKNLYYCVSAMMVGSVASFVAFFKKKAQLNDLKKYNLFMNHVSQKVKEYETIINKEKQLQVKKLKEGDMQVSKSHCNINTLDKVSLEKLKEIVIKIDRYNKLVGDNKPNLEKEKVKIKIK